MQEKIERCTNLWWRRIKAANCIIKVAITRGNAPWCSFALRGWAYKQISAWQPLLPSAKDLYFTFMYLLSCKSQSFSLYSFLFFSFGKHHVARKDLGTYIQLDMGSMSYYCWHHPWVEYVGRRNYKPLSSYVSGWNVLLMCMRRVLAIIEDYMMVEYVDLPRGFDTWPVGDMTIRYDPPRRGRVIPMAVHLNEAQEYIKMAVHRQAC